jgi:hypothetical protein
MNVVDLADYKKRQAICRLIGMSIESFDGELETHEGTKRLLVRFIKALYQRYGDGATEGVDAMMAALEVNRRGDGE